MRVLTQEAVLDPSKVEARVRREMTARQDAHATANAERKLTHEEKLAKLETKKAADESLGVYAAVFKVLNLSNGQHKFKIRKNAEQHNLTGCTLFHPRFALIVVEGGQKGIKAYTKLMLKRINWTEEAQARDNAELADGGDFKKVEDDPLMRPAVPIAENSCTLIWSGQHRERYFVGFVRRRAESSADGFQRPKNCETDHVAREFLGPRAEGYLDLVRRSQLSRSLESPSSAPRRRLPRAPWIDGLSLTLRRLSRLAMWPCDIVRRSLVDNFVCTNANAESSRTLYMPLTALSGSVHATFGLRRARAGARAAPRAARASRESRAFSRTLLALALLVPSQSQRRRRPQSLQLAQ